MRLFTYYVYILLIIIYSVLYVFSYLDRVGRMYFLDAGKLLQATSNLREIPENSWCDEPAKIPQPFNGRRIEIQKVKYNNGACPIVHRIKKNGIYIHSGRRNQKKSAI